MKITRRQLKRIIREEKRKLHESMAMDGGVELTVGLPHASEAAISAAWPDKVYYNGESVFETFYSDAAMDAAWRFVENSGYDDGQEAYLGYSPAADVFVMGFDVFPAPDDSGWGEPGGDMEGLLIELTPEGFPVEVITSAPGGMYPGGRNAAKQEFPDIIEVRLD